MELREYTNKNVLTAAKQRIAYTFDNFDKILLSFSGGKDSSVMFHLVMEEAVLRKRKIGVMMIDFEAQYKATSDHAMQIFDLYKEKRETIFAVYLDLQEQCNEIRRQRDFAMTLIKFIDMKNAMDTPSGTFEEVIRLMCEKDRETQAAFDKAQARNTLADLERQLGYEQNKAE